MYLIFRVKLYNFVPHKTQAGHIHTFNEYIMVKGKVGRVGSEYLTSDDVKNKAVRVKYFDTHSDLLIPISLEHDVVKPLILQTYYLI